MAPVSFSGPIDTTRLSWGYRAGLLVVALAMLLLPLVYVGVIALAGTGVWWHLTRHASWVQSGGSGLEWRLIGYAAPALAGTAVTFFMVKPMFARRPRRREPVSLNPAAQPALFAFITQICHQVRAPIPQRVQVDCEVNASASFAPGWRSVVRRELVLTIGLPLVHALSVRELGGVLAHEFGHFAQGSGLRLTMLVRGINGWFSRVVYERDSWDRRLDEWSRSGDGRLFLLIMPSRAGVWLSRQVLRLLMLGGHAISCFMTRQMEYDADSYEVKIAGSRAFASTMRRLRELNVAAASSSPYVNSELAARRLPADLPLFLVTWQRTRTAEPAASREGDGAAPATPGAGWFDTHPSDDDRLSAAMRAADHGILVGGHESAVQLFRDFDALSRHATRHYYEARGLLDEVSLVDAVDCVQASLGREERQQALFTIFDFGVSRFRPLSVPSAGSDAPPPGEVQTWRFPDALERFDDRMKQRGAAFAAQEVLKAGYTAIDPASFGLAEWTLESAAASEQEAIEKLPVLRRVLEPYEHLRLQRVARGLERLAASAGPQASVADLTALVRALDAAASALEIGFELARVRHAQMVRTALLDTHPQPQARARRDALQPQVDDALGRMRRALAGVPCPPQLGPAAPLDEVCRLAGPASDPMQALVAVETLHSRLLLEACWLALRGEAVTAAETAGV